MFISLLNITIPELPNTVSSWGAAIAAAAQVGGSLLSANAQKDANNKNVGLSREQMIFQDAMSNTAHQRQVRDLKAAGLNPILSATGGNGASTAAGSSATMAPVDLGSSAKSAADSFREYKMMDVQAQNTMADTALKAQSSALAQTQAAATAKDVERKSIDNSYQSALLAQDLKHKGFANEKLSSDSRLAAETLSANIRKASAESNTAEVNTKIARDQAKFGHLGAKYSDSLGLGPQSAKRSEKDNAFWNALYNTKDLLGGLFSKAVK
nr:MAG: DNA pilot protein [Microvirus sp.]